MLFVGGPFLGAQELEGNGRGTGSLFSPADYFQVSAPITDKVGVNAYGFYLGNVRASIALLEIPVAVHKHVVLTPSYLFVDVPPSGLAMLTNRTVFRSYRENQFRLAASVSVPWHGFSISDRNMYVRRFTPMGDVDRYRNKIYVARPLSEGSFKYTPFVFDEVYHDFGPGSWLRRNWVVAGVDLPVAPHLTFQPSYIRQDDSSLRSVNFLGIGVIVRFDPLVRPRHTRDRASSQDDQPAYDSEPALVQGR